MSFLQGEMMDWESKEGKELLASSLTVSFALLKESLANEVGWPYLQNLSWFQVWAGGWCLHGRAAVLKPQDSQRSMNFELPVGITDHTEALLAAIEKVKKHPERLKEKMRWYCPEHGWEEILPRGQMHSGCPKCGSYYCEPYKPEEEVS